MAKILHALHQRYIIAYEGLQYRLKFHRRELIEEMKRENYNLEIIYEVANLTSPPLPFEKWINKFFRIETDLPYRNIFH
ncbi:MAG: hypothetical protein RL557_398 [archaeon]|jgi:hypothetical protein